MDDHALLGLGVTLIALSQWVTRRQLARCEARVERLERAVADHADTFPRQAKLIGRLNERIDGEGTWR